MFRSVLIVLTVFSLFAGGCTGRQKTKEDLYSEGMKEAQAKKPGSAIIYFKNALEKDQNYTDARFQLAKAYFAVGKYDAAEKEYGKVLRQLPNSREAHIEIARTYVQNGKPDDALKEISASLEVRENDVETMEIRGGAHAQKGEFPKAVSMLQKVIALEPGRATSVIMLSRVHLLSGNLPEARAQIDGLLRADPSNRSAQMLLAEIQTRSGDAEAAFRTYDEILRNAPSDIEALYRKGTLYVEQGRADEALAYAAGIIKNFENRPEGYELRGAALFRKKQYKDAIIAYQKVVSLQPRPASYYFLALCHYNCDEFEQAMSQLQKALDQNAAFVPARILASLVHLRKGAFDESVSEIKRALAQDDRNAYAHSILGSAYLAKGMSAEGLAELNRALEIAPDLADARIKKGAYELGRGRTREAEAELAAAVRSAPDLLNGRILLATSYLKRNEYAKAISTAQDGLRNQKSDAVLYNIMADALLRQRKNPDAVAALQKAEGQDPDYDGSYFKLAAIYQLSGERAKAQDELKAIADRSSNNAQAQLALATLYENQGKEKESRAYYERARRSGSPAGAVEVARYYLRKKQPDTALAVLDEALQRNPSLSALLLLKGEVLMGQKRYDDAVRKFEDLAKTDAVLGRTAVVNAYIAMGRPEKALDRVQREMKAGDDRPELMAEVSRIYAAMGKGTESVENARRIVRKYPDLAIGYLTLAMAYQSAREPEKAIEALKKAPNIKDAELAMMLGNLYVSARNYPSALQAYRKAEALRPGYALAMFKQAAVQHTLGKRKEAIAGYQRVVKLSESYVPALNNLAYLYAEDRNSLADALQYAVRAYVLAPKDGSVQDTLGLVLLRNGKAEEGLKALKLAAESLPNDATVQFHLALACKELNQAAQAIEHLQKALSRDDFSEQRQARVLLAQLKNDRDRAGR